MNPEVKAKIEKAKKTKHLELRNQGLTEIPKEVFDIEGLWFLFIDNITALNPRDAHLHNYNKIDTISSEIGKLKELRILDAANSEIRELPDEIGELEKFKEIRYS